jgi:hypothetical protein
VYRLARLQLHSLVTRMGLDDWYRTNSKYPVHVVAAILKRAQEMDWDIKVEVGSGAGQMKSQKEARAMQMLELGAIDMETFRDMMGLDHKLIEQRMAAQRAQTVAGAAPPGAPPGPPPGPQPPVPPAAPPGVPIGGGGGVVA